MRLSSFFAILGLALVMALGLPAQTVRVIFVSGKAELQRPDEAALRPAVKGETVIIGTRIVTGVDGRVVLTPMPGVKSIITPNTTLLLESVAETRTSETNITHAAVLDLKQGAVVSDLQKPEGVTYDYSIRTARGLAGARGTTFTVGINAAGIQTIVVAHGAISINFTDGRQASLALGHLSITKTNGDTQAVSNISELPAADQKIATNWAEITINALADALENGVEVDPAALENALAAAKSLGIILSPETEAAVERALAKARNPEDIVEAVDPLKRTKEEQLITDPREIVNDEIPAETHVTPAPPPPPPTPLEIFRARLSEEQRPSFDGLPTDIQGQLVTLNDLDIAGVALANDQETGLPLTHDDLRFHLAAFSKLSLESLVFVKTLAGAHLADLDETPDPAEWSPAAFERTLASWNDLSDSERSQIKNMGAGKVIMDTSAGYISALLNELNADQRALITETGWGAYLDDLAGKPTGQNILINAAYYLDETERAAVKFFDISPDSFNNGNIVDIVEALAALTPAEQQIVRQLGIADLLIEEHGNPSYSYYYEAPSYADDITNALNFYASLNPDEKVAARALGLGRLLYEYAPDDSIGESSVTALQRARELTAFYINNPNLRQALQDSGLLSDSYFFYSSETLNTSLVTSTLNTYLALPERTRSYLLASDHSHSFFVLAHPELQYSYSNLNTLETINGLLSQLSTSEFSTLLDLDLSKAIIESGYSSYDYEAESYVLKPYFEGTLLDAIKATIAYYKQLDSAKKFVLRELAIVGDQNLAIVGADPDGLTRLLIAYSTLPGSLRATTERLDETQLSSDYMPTFGSSEGDIKDRSFFFPRGYDSETVVYSVGFESTRDLYVGATRYLRLDGSGRDGPTFIVGDQGNLHLHAANLIDLYATGFSANIRSITMAAHTINLTHIVFPEGSVASLNSKFGQLNFGPSTNNGMINLNAVRYGNSCSPILDADNFAAESRGNIATGTLANPAALPTYTPPSPDL